MSGRWYGAPATLALAVLAAGLVGGCSGDAAPSPAPERPTSPASDAATHSASPTASPTARPESPPLTRVLVVGDIMLGRGVATPEAPVRPLRFLADRIDRADIAVGTLESTLSDNGEPQQPNDDSFFAPLG